MSALTELAEEALEYARRLDDYIRAKGLPPVSIENDSLTTAALPPELQAARDALTDTSHNMKRLAQGPVNLMFDIVFGFTSVISLHAIYEYNLPSRVPLSGGATYAEIAQASGLSESLCRRFLLHAMENGIFIEEASTGQVRHSALSRLLATNRDAFHTTGLAITEYNPAATRVVEALQRFQGSGAPNATAYNLAHGTELPIYSFLEQDPTRMKRFGNGMKFACDDIGMSLHYLEQAYPWRSIDRPGTVVVDLGGGIGTVSRWLAFATEHIQFVVQDLPGPTAVGHETLPTELQGRVRYEPADFLAEQQIVGAEAYFLRWILHNWSDEYCLRILRALVPALRNHSKVLVYEYILSESPELGWTRKQKRNLDMIMMACWNSSERTATDFQRLFHMADERFVFEGRTQPEGSTMALATFGWRDEVVKGH
ncbi:hypothetical protein BBP40_006690 [Aspergillus hancockii]|nr:hypothetical protein BBP40_006690 [Aspergillus hancockii]